MLILKPWRRESLKQAGPSRVQRVGAKGLRLEGSCAGKGLSSPAPLAGFDGPCRRRRGTSPRLPERGRHSPSLLSKTGLSSSLRRTSRTGGPTVVSLSSLQSRGPEDVFPLSTVVRRPTGGGLPEDLAQPRRLSALGTVSRRDARAHPMEAMQSPSSPSPHGGYTVAIVSIT